MRIYVLLADDRKVCLSIDVLNVLKAEWERHGNVEVDVLKLYDYADQIPFYIHDTSVLESNPFFIENRERFLSADYIVLIYPVYWYAPPAIMKAWMDLITNFAWKFQGGHMAKPLHSIKKALVVTSSMESSWYRSIVWGSPVKKQVLNFLRWIGVRHTLFHVIGSVYHLTPQQFEWHAVRLRRYASMLIES